jgi:hypothetical protein
LELLHYGSDIVFLEQADGGDSGGSGCQAGLSVGQSYASEGEEWDIRFARFAECGKAGGAYFFFPEDWSEYRYGCAVDGGLGYVFGRVTGDCDLRCFR